MRKIFAQRQTQKNSCAFQTRFAGFLELPEDDYARLIRDIESDPLFIRLKYAQSDAERAIRARCLRQTGLSNKFFEFKEEFNACSGADGAEVDKLLADKEKLVRTIRKIGEADFVKYFIHNEDGHSLSDIARFCGLKPAEAGEILELINTVDIYGEFFVASERPQENNFSCRKIAVIAKTPEGFKIEFLSAHWARGLYEVDYEKLARMSDKGKLSERERAGLKKLLERIELINLRKSLMHSVISGVLKKQSGYFNSGGEKRPLPFRQIELAEEIKVHPSAVSRAIAGRSIETPWGEEKPLKLFFSSGKAEQREKVLLLMERIFDEEKTKLMKGELQRPLSDSAIAVILNNKHNIAISGRTVTKYREISGIPGAFSRAKI
ncbi:MAG TPA: hypothetical protein DEE98_04925 [Elusimicrobia bacterium]|nr:MAG: hypothetical protein A2278_04605 [Elusimicrobia bacterium RIFOXYA12_FULL_49_49]OGS10372.1 MAG: hypothetical protein A2386_02290 [Elusimicrobia bacterium RIFOXYB1_FULL_48_9]OGS14673.1 MAG: hypothetical protein A2251_09235 [Elusimicrobia bacterium RIFOXYA2_FULL_47_53]OGS25675.1 MAG: hypothetical protein A2339_06355 [Elusimicrobia bacterium RIFOXYB12_FULL_50_12]OGS31764.1 MAG: hypothetical protein A2323_06145 [Elusimicrobia bacterium RIFOXYB2_FULL_46_23]HBU69707.1 hypothetical protein [El